MNFFIPIFFSFFFKRSPSKKKENPGCSIISKRTIAAFASSSFTTNNNNNNLSFTLQTQYLHHSSTPSSHPVKNGDTAYPFLFPKNRAFHFKSGLLNFKASSPSLAKYATIADYKSEASSSSLSPKADEGLEVAKLGISQEIISALAKGVSPSSSLFRSLWL